MAIKKHHIGAFTAQRVHGLDLHSVERAKEHRDSLMLRDIGVSPSNEERILAILGPCREHFLAIDYPLITVANGPGLDGRKVGAHIGFRVSETKADVT